MGPLVVLSMAVTATAAEDLTTGVRAEGEPSIDLVRVLLDIPGALVELAFTPLEPFLYLIEKGRLGERFFDLITNEDRTLAVLPVVDPFNGSGLGFGGVVVHNSPLGSEDRTVFVGLVRMNGDRSASLSVARRLPFLSGRVLSAGARYSVDRDMRYFDLGADGEKEHMRRLRVDGLEAHLGIEIVRPSFAGFGAELEVGYRHRELSAGTAPGELGVGEDALVTPPPGFGRALDYPELTLKLTFDTRDSIARTTTGFISALEATFTHDLDGGGTGGVLARGSFGGFIELLPLYRVLFLSAGAAASFPIQEDIPLHHLVQLGGNNLLRSYPRERFVERLGWWVTAEYRYHFFEYAATGYGLASALFIDVGRVGHDPKDLFGGPPAWSFGLGFRVETNLITLGRAQIAYGPEGFRFSIGFGELP
jgi:outer membrane protein assembly factor BamA